MKILFDTDPGIDDAMALLMLARDARAELVGITTVYGNASVETTTANALSLCARFSIDVPVARGADRPLERVLTGYPDFIHGRNGMGDIDIGFPPRRTVETDTAADFLSAMARRHSGELTIVAVAPLTNLALALRRDPALVDHVRQVVVMGGAFGVNGHRGNATPVAEANIANDPRAADEVLAARWPVTLVGLDVTHEVRMSTDYLERLGRDGGAEGAFIREISIFYEDAYRHRIGGGIFSHDASAVACALDPSPFVLRRGPVRVVLDGLARGQTIQVPEGSVVPDEWAGIPSQSVCIGVDAERLRREFLQCFVH